MANGRKVFTPIKWSHMEFVIRGQTQKLFFKGLIKCHCSPSGGTKSIALIS